MNQTTAVTVSDEANRLATFGYYILFFSDNTLMNFDSDHHR